MGLEVNYKGNKIGQLDTDGSLTLNTAGKYCEEDITLNLSESGGGQGDICDMVRICEYDATSQTWDFGFDKQANFSVYPAVDAQNYDSDGNTPDPLSLIINLFYRGGSTFHTEISLEMPLVEDTDHITLASHSSNFDSNIIALSLDSCMYINDLTQICTPQLRYIKAPNCIEIGDFAFSSNWKLETIIAPNVRKIGESAFSTCNYITELNFPLCTEVGSYLFCAPYEGIGTDDYSYSLVTANLPSCVEIKDYAFAGCRELRNINFPSCTTIGEGAFWACCELSECYFPACTTVGEDAFNGCENIIFRFPSMRAVESYSFAGMGTGGPLELHFPNCVSVAAHSFDGCYYALEIAEFDSGCVFGAYCFDGIFTSDERTKPFKLYLRGTTVGSCDPTIFGDAFLSAIQATNTGGSSSASISDGTIYGEDILEIYVPADLIDEFKTGGWSTFADFIYPIPEEAETEEVENEP